MISLLALIISLGGAGYSATGGNFILGQANSANTQTRLTSPVAATAFRIDSTSAQTGATALGLYVGTGRTPFTVNSTVKVTRLNADLLDGIDSASFAQDVGEGWHYVGDAGQPAFQNSWTNFNAPGSSHNSATNQHAAFRIDNFGVIHLGGLVAGGTIGQPIFTLPPAYCPLFTKVFPAISNNAFARITVNRFLSGCAVFANFGSNAWVSLEGVSFLSYNLELRISS
jgi:hypothetical protein